MHLYSASGTLEPRPPFDFAHSLRFASVFLPLGKETVIAPDRLSLVLYSGPEPILVNLSAEGAPRAARLAYRLYSRHALGEYATFAAVSHLRFFLGLDDDLGLFYELGREDAHFSIIIERLFGYHQVKFPTAFECACWMALSQRGSFAGSMALRERLVDAFGATLEVHGQSWQAFPLPVRLVKAGSGEIAAIVGSARKARSLNDVATAFSTLEPPFLREAPYAEVERWLRAIDGIGPRAATFVLIRGLGRMDKAPVDDPVLLDAVRHVYDLPAKPSPQQVRRMAHRYGHWQGYWAHYLRVATLLGRVAPTSFLATTPARPRSASAAT